MKKIKKFDLIFQTIRYLTFRQWIFRIWYIIRSKLFRNRKAKILSIGTVHPFNEFYKYLIANDCRINIANSICKNSFLTISDIQLDFKNEIDWDMYKYPYRLVIFRLNSFHWLLDLSAAYKKTKDKNYILHGFNLIDDWQNKNGKTICGDKWNPYVISERLINWIGFCSEYCNLFGKDILVYAGYIASQANELSKSIEYHLGGNHLLSEAKALMYAGAFLENSKLYNQGKKILTKEYTKQFMKDGSHYEQSISYHVESLQQYFEAYALMQIMNDKDLYSFAKKMIKPYEYLNNMICADGAIPLVNDAALDYPFDAKDFLSTANLIYTTKIPNNICGHYYEQWKFVKKLKLEVEWKSIYFHENSGYLNYFFTFKGKKYSLFFDAGNSGPDSNLGHAHADALSILLSSEDNPILVDSGVFSYMPEKDRMQCRSTKAHNTVEIDGKNSIEVWSAFRVAKRGRTEILKYEDTEQFLKISARYDGYKKILKDSVYHTRSIVIDKLNGIIEIRDDVSGKKQHQGNMYFHISPSINSKNINNNEVKLDNILFDSSEPVKIKSCEIARNFGIKEETTCLLINFEFKGNKSIVSRFKL